MYQPKPLNTDKIALPPELDQLLEQLASNTHEVWAAQRIKEGWCYGEQRNDEKREHPSLIPYEQLSEQEKDYDRNTAREVLKMIIASGFLIKKV